MESLTEQFNYVITQLATSVFIPQHMTVLLQPEFLCWFWQLMCDLINNHTDGGENWTVMRRYVEKKKWRNNYKRKKKHTHKAYVLDGKNLKCSHSSGYSFFLLNCAALLKTVACFPSASMLYSPLSSVPWLYSWEHLRNFSLAGRQRSRCMWPIKKKLITSRFCPATW